MFSSIRRRTNPWACFAIARRTHPTVFLANRPSRRIRKRQDSSMAGWLAARLSQDVCLYPSNICRAYPLGLI